MAVAIITHNTFKATIFIIKSYKFIVVLFLFLLDLKQVEEDPSSFG